MKPSEYLHDALRTEPTPIPDFIRMDGATAGANLQMARLLHAILGFMTEVGEIADALKRRLIYGEVLDELNLIEEHGDESWYQNLLIDALGSTWEESWSKNIAKLRVRFPDKFTQTAALKRDLAAERRALEATRDVCGEPTGTHGRDECGQTMPCSMHGPFNVTRQRGEVDGRRGHPPTELSPECVVGYTLGQASKPCDGQFRTVEDYRDHLPCNVCEPVKAPVIEISNNVYKMLKAEITALIAARDGAHVEAANWRRAEKHGCDVGNGDPDCG